MSKFFRAVLIALSITSFIATGPVSAAAQKPYDAKTFEAAQAAGKPVLIEIHADWCPTCKAQLPILNKLSAEGRYAPIERMRVDFDSQKALVKVFKANMQSTLVLFKGKMEVARSVAVTDPAAIQAMLDKAL